MTPQPAQSVLAALALPAPALWALAGAGVAAWITLRRLRRDDGSPMREIPPALLRVAVGAGALLALAKAAGTHVEWTSGWPAWAMAPVAAASVEVVILLYGLERRAIGGGTAATALGALRAVLVLLVAAMLLGPVFVLQSSERSRRTLAVLVDTSASMQVRDTGFDPSAKLRLAEVLIPGTAERPLGPERIAADLRGLAEQLSVQVEWLRMVGAMEPDVLGRHLDTRAEELRGILTKFIGRLEEHRASLSKAAEEGLYDDEEAAADLRGLDRKLDETIGAPLRRSAEALGAAGPPPAERHGLLLEWLGALVQDARALAHEAARQGVRLDGAFYAGMPDETRQRVDALLSRARVELARMVLEGSGENEGLLAGLEADYRLRRYDFAGAPSEAGIAPDAAAGAGTDLAAALKKVSSEVGAERLAGVVVLTDGRHNAAEPVEPLARQLGAAGVPVCPVVMGLDRPPRDAAVIAVEVPDTVHAEDVMRLTADLKLDDLAGTAVRVELHRQGVEEPVDATEVQVPRSPYRTRVELTDTPAEAGLHSYRVSLAPVEGEVLTANNDRALAVSVTEEKTKVLIIEERPRWEFRYLKNLFSGRDATVRLQYVLLKPERIAGTEPLPEVPASASRPEDQAQATALPANEVEWQKFDVVILGDVSPQALRGGPMRALGDFVTDRGGTVVVVAGPRHMPRAFVGTALETMLPSRVSASGPEPDAPVDAYRIGLSHAGLESPIMRQAAAEARNRAVWRSFPELHWRLGGLSAKPGATVLARAIPSSKEDGQTDGPEPEAPPLILHHRLGMGKVLMLTFDRTWRFRYRAGDEHHHRFWGQVLRWATAQKLAAGTRLVKLGTTQARYAPGADVQVRARLLKPDLSPVSNAQVAVQVRRGGEPVLRRRMTYLPDTPGVYGGGLGALPPGKYRIELRSPEVERLLRREGARKVVAEFAVDPAVTPELVELAPNRELLERLAELSGGAVAEPAGAARALWPLRPATFQRTERSEYVIWNSPPFLAAILALAAGEWVLRRKRGLP